MVFFNCNACGEALKKNQVEKHLLRCRQCQALSCVDCGNDFWGDDYQSHTKCMTEDEKYCGKGYVPKVNKGEVKQEQWIEKVQAAIEKSASNPKLKGLLEKLKDYPNIPRKKVKFENFLKNSLRVLSQPLIAQVWENLMAATGQNQNQENEQKLSEQVPENVNGSHAGNESLFNSEGIQPMVESIESDQKTSKRDKKEARRQKMSKKEKKDKNGDAEKDDGFSKRKKRKHSEGEEDKQIETALAETTDEPVRKKKKKQKGVAEDENLEAGVHESRMNGTPADDNHNEEEPTEVIKKRKKVKFDWEGTVTAVLKSRGEISLKKMRKKVLQEFAAQNAANYTDENLKAKFEKKIRKMSQVKIQKDRVRLK